MIYEISTTFCHRWTLSYAIPPHSRRRPLSELFQTFSIFWELRHQ